MKKIFVGRAEELSKMAALFDSTRSQILVVKGRRRIGKTELILQLCKILKGAKSHYLTASPPQDGMTETQERALFADHVSRTFGLKYDPPQQSWAQLLHFIADICNARRNVLVLDEINWMGSQCDTFLNQLHSVWETNLSRRKGFLLILAGSLSSWLEENILHHTGFVGRVSMDLTVRELPLSDCVKFWGDKRQQVSDYELIKHLCVTGGVPKYIEELSEKLNAEQNIHRLCLSPEGMLFDEFEDLFHSLFSNWHKLYREILQGIAHAKTKQTPKQLALAIDRPVNGAFTDALIHLEQAGFIARDFSWDPKTTRKGKTPQLRISDCYTAFYFRVIDKHREKILQGNLSLHNLPGLLGLQFENLVLTNKVALWKLLGINRHQIDNESPFYQSPRTRRAGCQIDYLIQTKGKIFFICEFKFSENKVGHSVVNSVQSKVDALQIPRQFTYRKVLVHVNGITPAVEDADFFDHIVSISQLM